MGVLSLSCLLGRTRPNGNGDSPNSFAEINVVHNLDILPGNRDKVQKSGANKFAVLESLEEEDNGGGGEIAVLGCLIQLLQLRFQFLVLKIKLRRKVLLLDCWTAFDLFSVWAVPR